MTEPKKASITISKALVNISLTTIAAIGSAMGIPWIAGATALPAAIVASEAVRLFLAQNNKEVLELPVPPWWTRSEESWQTVCSSIEYHLPSIMETVATQLKQLPNLPTQAIVKQTFIQALSQQLPIWELPIQERGLVAAYITPLFLTKVVKALQPLLDQKHKDQQAEMIVKIFDLLNAAQQATLPSIAAPLSSLDHSLSEISSITTILEQKLQKAAYNVYICYNEEDEAEVFAIGKALKVHGILPWFDFLGKPGGLRAKQQEHLIEVIPAAAIFVGQHAIMHWQELQMYAFLNQFIERECPIIPVLLKSAPLKPKLPPFLGTLVWVDFRRSVPDPLTQFIWGIKEEHDTPAID